MTDGSVAQLRIARPTKRLAKIVRFYVDGLGLAVVATFTGHAGCDGVILSLPGRSDHLEFTSSARGSRRPSPTNGTLLAPTFAELRDGESSA